MVASITERRGPGKTGSVKARDSSRPFADRLLGPKAPDAAAANGYPGIMKPTSLALAALIFASAFPLRAQVAAEPAGKPAPAKPAASCPCDNAYFKPLTEKARAVEAYWDARRKTKIATVVAGTGALFSLLLRSPNGMRESTEAYERARSEMWTAKAKAESLGALKVTGDDIDGVIEFKIKAGVDYTVKP